MRASQPPKALIQFVAKTGFVTRETWEMFFFAGGTKRWRDKAWHKLIERGYFTRHPCQRLQGVYVLNRRRPDILSLTHGGAVRPPFATQLNHDEVLNRGLLRAEREKLISHWRTEAELKAFGGGSHRIESRERLLKFPDALIHISGREDEPPVAVECELTLKSRERYMQILGAYSAMTDISGVLFVCGEAVIERALKEVADRIYFPVDEIKLEFVSLEHWLRNLALKKFSNGSQ